MTDATEELTALEDLVASHGWRVFLAHVEAEWGPLAYRVLMNKAFLSAASRDEQVLTAREVETTTRQIELLASWPKNRIETLRQQIQKPVAEVKPAIKRPAPRRIARPA